MHLRGRAIDMRLSGFPTLKLRELATALQCGGAGFYATSDFVHMDTGRVRLWRGRHSPVRARQAPIDR